LSVSDFLPRPFLSLQEIVRLILARIPTWRTSQRLQAQLQSYGFSDFQADSSFQSYFLSLTSFLPEVVSDEEASVALKKAGFHVDQLKAIAPDNFAVPLEAALLRHFLSSISTQPLPDQLKEHIRALLDVTDISHLPFSGEYISARSMSRHFHLHIGPTNSGKTYSALKALSRAGTGAYAGPLRLLAHEVWERLNLGTVGDMNGKGRECNLVTGEERRIVDPDAGLISCTVEMLPISGPLGSPYDVVVVDEIQMMGDPQRGSAWTNVVMKLRAHEIHLCGDETTVGLLKRMVASFGGDQLTVHRYDRLTPLTVADKSLGSSYKGVRKGDCVVTFSRSGIFYVRREVESFAKKKCAMVYGALPPETRAEQARDFNDENGRAEVLVASDAVGMGLNLKIKRMIFSSLHKFNGKQDVPLSLTQIKQIAGRAGRFGMSTTTPDPHATPQLDLPSIAPDEKPSEGGIVTTFHESDLPILRSLLHQPLPPITRATLDVPFENMSALAALLPPETKFSELLDHVYSLVLVPPNMTLGSMQHKLPLAKVVEEFRSGLTLSEMDLLTYAPVNGRDPRALGVYHSLASTYASVGHVTLDNMFDSSGFYEQLRKMEKVINDLINPPSSREPQSQTQEKPKSVSQIISDNLPGMETLHKTLVLYIWLSYRREVSFPDREKALGYKERTEVVLEKCLEHLPGYQKKSGVKGMRGQGKVKPVYEK
ncbi:hypothetical protein TREMEDRAFT_12580, partial [Tremella mesenterica DSM 1558]|uniref:uncharacterized protein n=1 Tax=Tremella mesenterica (strain ATCC 24925 / CBS 8224 / DSM 1558 / NBRC 9311 / NRRL Y-6157 / RJB 2259-6 / UBC 559-6) TaxID=578456 RepID=UPI0003F48E26